MNTVVLKIIEDLKRDPIRKVIDQRMKEFEEVGKKNNHEVFKELCFCFLTANFNAAGGIRIQKEIGDGFMTLTQGELAEKLAQLRHRFPNARADFIFQARYLKDNIKEKLDSFEDDKHAREWFADNVKGLGMKESSHFLRNIGRKNVAIIDFHIVDFLVKSELTERPKTLTKKKYLEIEKILQVLADETDLSLGELDLYLWYHETGTVLK